MKYNPIPSLIAVLTLTLLLLFPYTPYGQEVMKVLFPSGNLAESSFLTFPAPEGSGSPLSEGVPLSSYCADLTRDLPGSYTLISLRDDSGEFSDDLLMELRARGIPMLLVLRDDGTASLRIFDESRDITFREDAMLLLDEGNRLPFFYFDGRLTIADGSNYMVFQKDGF